MVNDLNEKILEEGSQIIKKIYKNDPIGIKISELKVKNWFNIRNELTGLPEIGKKLKDNFLGYFEF